MESAYFLPSSIRKTSKILGIETDANIDLKRGIDPNSINEGLEKATNLILKICGGEASKFQIVGKKIHKTRIIKLEPGQFKNYWIFYFSYLKLEKYLLH